MTARVKFITKRVAEDLEEFFTQHADKIVAKTGYDLKVAAIGGRYNKERIVIEIGMLPTDAQEYRLDDLSADMAENHKYRKNVAPDTVKKIVKFTGLPANKVRHVVDDWYNNEHVSEFDFRIGSRFMRNDGDLEYRVIGYNLHKSRVVLFCVTTKRVVLCTLADIHGMEQS